MHWIVCLLSLVVSVEPTRTWYPPEMPLTVHVAGTDPAALVLTDFTGRVITATDVAGGATVDIKAISPQVSVPASYILYQTPAGGDVTHFTGTPLVISVRGDGRRGASPGPVVYQVVPLRYAKLQTDAGSLTVAFYYNSAPNTVDNFIRLCEDGFYEGLTFHRVIPGYLVQAGDPLGTGTGGPGYRIDAEFNDRPHGVGVLSMARQRDPLEPVALPRSEFANSAGSQFFICLDAEKTRSLDRRSSAFGIVTDGMDVVRTIANTPLLNADTGRPRTPPVIQKITLHPVTPTDNPYSKVLRPPDVPELEATDQPVAAQTQPTGVKEPSPTVIERQQPTEGPRGGGTNR